MFSEKELINYISNTLAQPTKGLGIGDDCAVIPKDDHTSLLVSTDSLVENTHFKVNYQSPFQLGQKLITVNVSDVYAMGGKPEYILIALSSPSLCENWTVELVDGIEHACEKYKIHLIGGDTTKSASQMFINVTVIGEAQTKLIKYRNGAKAGDYICYCGLLGWSKLGLKLLDNNLLTDNQYTEHYRNPQIPFLESELLGSLNGVSAMMDISDGLHQDIETLCKASQIGAEINVDQLPHDARMDQLCREYEIEPIDLILSGGEDYALLFTVDPNKYEQIQDEFYKRFSRHFTKIGKVTEGSKITYKDSHETLYVPTLDLFKHF